MSELVLDTLPDGEKGFIGTPEQPIRSAVAMKATKKTKTRWTLVAGACQLVCVGGPLVFSAELLFRTFLAAPLFAMVVLYLPTLIASGHAQAASICSGKVPRVAQPAFRTKRWSVGHAPTAPSEASAPMD